MQRRDFLKTLIGATLAPVALLERAAVPPVAYMGHIWGCDFYVSEYALDCGVERREAEPVEFEVSPDPHFGDSPYRELYAKRLQALDRVRAREIESMELHLDRLAMFPWVSP